MQLNKQINTKKKTALIIAVTLAVIILLTGLFVLLFTPVRDRLIGKNETPTAPIRDTNSVDYSGPSKTDTAESQNGKKNNSSSTDITPSTDSTPTNTPELKDAPVAISYAGATNGKVEIRAFIPSVIEGSGTCVARLVKNSKTVEASSKAFIDASSSQCEPIYIDLSKFETKGKWKLTVTYTSPTHKGSSDPEDIDL